MRPPLYIGIAKDDTHYGMYLHDGFYTVDYMSGAVDKAGEIKNHIMTLSQEWKIVLVALDQHSVNGSLDYFASWLWLEMDILCITVESNGNGSGGRVIGSVEETACAVVRRAQYYMAPSSIATITNVNLGWRNRVEVDGDMNIRLVTAEDYKPYVPPAVRHDLFDLIHWAKEKKLRLAFISSTPRGGGVALMRHSFVRFCRLNGLDVHWYVMRPHAKVFTLTKIKFHNVLQGIVTDEAYRLTAEDKTTYASWCETNVRKSWWTLEADVFVLDDPQVVGCVTWLKQQHPSALYLYRNHIHMDKEEIDNVCTVAHETFMYLAQYISQCDGIVSHPICLPASLECLCDKNTALTAVTDPLDGLNKQLSHQDQDWYYHQLTRLCDEMGATVPSQEKRWIVQIARFDPSKGIHDVLKAFKMVSTALHDCHLILAGHGSIDDPEGSLIRKQTQEMVENMDLSHRTTVIQCPPSDQLLNFILGKAHLALQLSYKEGFEVKVTEAIMKGVPVIAYATGGIPLQIKHQVTGILVDTGDFHQVANHVNDLLSPHGQAHYEKMKQECIEYRKGDAKYMMTPFNVYRWLQLIRRHLEVNCEQ